MKNTSKLIIGLASFLILTVLITPIIQADNLTNSNFSPLMRQFIKDGKKVRLLLKQRDKKLILNPCRDIVGKNLQNKDETFKLKKETLYRIKYINSDNIFWRLQVFATYDQNKANNIKQQLINSGYQNVNIVREEKYYKVQVGHFAERNKVKSLAAKLKRDGWENWPVSYQSTEKAEKIRIYNPKGEVVFSGFDFSLKGKLELDGKLFQGGFEFLYSSRGINVFHTTKLTNLLGGLVRTEIKKDKRLDQPQYFPALKARTVALRTHILYKYFNKSEDYLIFPSYQGLDKIDYNVKRSINLTRGEIIFGQGQIFRVFSNKGNDELITDENSFTIAEAIKMALYGRDYQKILSLNYPNTKIKDFSEKKYQVLKLETSIHWGLKYKEFRQITWAGQRVISILDLDLNKNNFRVAPFLSRGSIKGLADLSTVVKHRGALAGINGGFYNYTGRPLGLLIKSNQIVSESLKNRTALALTENNEVLIDRVSWTGLLQSSEDNGKNGGKIKITGANRPPNQDEIVIYNNYYGYRAPRIKSGIKEMTVVDNQIINIADTVKVKGTKIPENGFIVQAHGKAVKQLDIFKTGEKVEIKHRFNKKAWNNKPIVNAIGGGPTILNKGKINITGKKEEFQSNILQGRAPRSAAGITADNHLVFVTVDGRQPGLSIGITLHELALFMKEYGVKEALNLDGGASARMVVRGYTMSNPSEKRLISNGLLIFEK